MSCKLSPQETVCMKCQSLFSGKNKKKYFKISFIEIFPSMPNAESWCESPSSIKYMLLIFSYHVHPKCMITVCLGKLLSV